MLGTIEFLPFILFSLPAGAWVDRLRRRPILIAGDIGRAVLLASIPVAYALDVLTIWQLYVVGFVAGTLTVFFDVSYQSYLPSLVDRDQLIEGNSKLEVTRTIAQTAGPALSGGLIGLLTAPIAILLDSISYGVSAFFVFLIRRQEPTPDRHVDEHGQARERAAQGGRGRPALRPRQPVPARHRGRDRHVQPVQQHRLRDLHRVRRPRTRPVAGRDRDHLRDRQPWVAVRGVHRQSLECAVRPGPDDHRSRCS